jgi:hypothetical protein
MEIRRSLGALHQRAVRTWFVAALLFAGSQVLAQQYELELLPLPNGETRGILLDISRDGSASVGYAVSTSQSARLWCGGKVYELHNAPSGFEYSEARVISEDGRIQAGRIADQGGIWGGTAASWVGLF